MGRRWRGCWAPWATTARALWAWPGAHRSWPANALITWVEAPSRTPSLALITPAPMAPGSSTQAGAALPIPSPCPTRWIACVAPASFLSPPAAITLPILTPTPLIPPVTISITSSRLLTQLARTRWRRPPITARLTFTSPRPASKFIRLSPPATVITFLIPARHLPRPM